MPNDGLILKIDAALAERLRIRATAVGQTVEEYAIGILTRAVEQPGLAESETRWDGPLAPAAHDDGDDLDQDSEAYADYIDRICDEAERTGGVPFEVFRERLRNLGQRR